MQSKVPRLKSLIWAVAVWPLAGPENPLGFLPLHLKLHLMAFTVKRK